MAACLPMPIRSCSDVHGEGYQKPFRWKYLEWDAMFPSPGFLFHAYPYTESKGGRTRCADVHHASP
jgi:hypothetical protein